MCRQNTGDDQQHREGPMFKQSAHGNALAAGHVLIALMDTLIDKGVITRSDAQDVLSRAAAEVKKTNATTVAGTEAQSVIASLLGRYT
jgi:hypothetical protein